MTRDGQSPSFFARGRSGTSAHLILGAVVALAAAVWPARADAQFAATSTPVADGCHYIRAENATGRFLNVHPTTGEFSLSTTPQPFRVRQLAGWRSTISTSTGRYLTVTGNVGPDRTVTVPTAAEYDTPILWEFVTGSGQVRIKHDDGFLANATPAHYLSWASIDSAPASQLTAVQGSGPNDRQWGFEAAPVTSCAPGNAIGRVAWRESYRDNVRAEGCMAMRGGSNLAYTVRYEPGTFVNGYSLFGGLPPDRFRFYFLPLTTSVDGNLNRYLIFDEGGLLMFSDLNEILYGVRRGPGGLSADYFWEVNHHTWSTPGQFALKLNPSGVATNEFLSWQTIFVDFQQRLQTQPGPPIEGDQRFALDRRTDCTLPAGSGLGGFYQHVDNLPTDAADLPSLLCWSQIDQFGGFHPCYSDAQVSISSYFPLIVDSFLQGWHSGGGWGNGEHIYKDEVDRCSRAHDLNFWFHAGPSPSVLNSHYGLMTCYSRIVPKTKQEARAKALLMNSFLALLAIPPGWEYWELPNDRLFFQVGSADVDPPYDTGFFPRYGGDMPCPTVLDAAAPFGWRRHANCLSTQIVNLCPRIAGDVDQDCDIDVDDTRLMRLALGGVGTLYDKRDANQDRSVDHLDLANMPLIMNGSFNFGAFDWHPFALPDAGGITWNTVGERMQFYRTGTQAVVFQKTGVPLPANAPLVARFSLGNTDTVRKRISVLLHDADFSDLHVCTFWLPAGAPVRPYVMGTFTTKAWTDVTLSFYAASVNAPGNTTGFYQIDDVSLTYVPTTGEVWTACTDPWAPTPPGGAAGPDLVTNGNFSSGLAPWTTFGQITSQIANGVFEFVRPAGTPAGVVLQSTGQAIAANEILTAQFLLGNSSSVRKRVTVLIHDVDFSDLTACTFWLAPSLPLQSFGMRVYASEAWTNATISFYAATVGTESVDSPR